MYDRRRQHRYPLRPAPARWRRSPCHRGASAPLPARHNRPDRRRDHPDTDRPADAGPVRHRRGHTAHRHNDWDHAAREPGRTGPDSPAPDDPYARQMPAPDDNRPPAADAAAPDAERRNAAPDEDSRIPAAAAHGLPHAAST